MNVKFSIIIPVSLTGERVGMRPNWKHIESGENPEGIEVGRGGVHGSNGGQKGTVYEQPGTEVDFPSQLEGAK